MTHSRYVFVLLVGVAFFSLSSGAHADDEYVKKAKSWRAQDFDRTLPDQPIEGWLRSNIPAPYAVVWGEHITDCGEGTGTAVDKERDMPLCAEVELKDGPRVRGYLALFVGTQKRGLLKDGSELYFGYLEHRGTKNYFKRLRDVLKIK